MSFSSFLAPDATPPSLEPETESAVVARDLRKIYLGRDPEDPKEALAGLDLSIPRGCIFGLLGPNGAGKSTFINILAGLVTPTAGTASLFGYDVQTAPRAARHLIGVVPQELNIDTFFTARETLESQAGLFGVPKRSRITDELLDIFDLFDIADMPTRTLSGGMRRRLMVAKAMVHKPPLLVLDEPTAGVDVELRRTLWAYIRKLNADGTTIVLTTHYLEEAEELCSKIAIIHQGALVAHDDKDALLRRLDTKHVTITVDRDLAEVPATLQAQGWALLTPRRLTLAYKPSQITIGRILLAVQVNGLVITDLSTHDSDLEDVFLRVTQTDK